MEILANSESSINRNQSNYWFHEIFFSKKKPLTFPSTLEVVDLGCEYPELLDLAEDIEEYPEVSDVDPDKMVGKPSIEEAFDVNIGGKDTGWPAWIPILNPAEEPTLEGGDPDLLRVLLKLALLAKTWVKNPQFENSEIAKQLRFSLNIEAVNFDF